MPCYAMHSNAQRTPLVGVTGDPPGGGRCYSAYGMPVIQLYVAPKHLSTREKVPLSISVRVCFCRMQEAPYPRFSSSSKCLFDMADSDRSRERLLQPDYGITNKHDLRCFLDANTYLLLHSCSQQLSPPHINWHPLLSSAIPHSGAHQTRELPPSQSSRHATAPTPSRPVGS
jgi:hypothetical protein